MDKSEYKKATEDITGIICIRNCPLSSEMEKSSAALKY